jgi:hypothetical protein
MFKYLSDLSRFVSAKSDQPVEMDTAFLSDTSLTAQFDAQCRRIPDRSYKHIIFRKMPAETLVR